MKRCALAVAFLVLPSVVFAQQASQTSDPLAAVYSQLLSEANSRVAASGAQIQQMQVQILDLQKQLAAAMAAKSSADSPASAKTP